MQVYWASVFILPDAIIKEIEKILRGFLWCQGEMKKGKAKVKWDDLCLPKDEGGLGIKRLKYWNIALMATHVWRILNHKESLWVKWIHEYHLKDKSFWDVPIKPDIEPPVLQQGLDSIKWKSVDGLLRDFSVATAYDDIRPRALKVIWFRVVWFTQCIPCHAFITWLLLRDKLKTQDRMRVGNLRQPNTSMSVVQGLLRFPNAPISSSLASGPDNNSAVMVAKLIFAASVYFIWQERNSRLFRGTKRSIERIFDDIYATVRLKLLYVHFKESRQIKQLKISWKIY
ncbi:uncharacterized protein [Rutidosis leptorrhynchoides]|uniref:uncharacterized protein n=1 Tax=Rutidosis leptorrhynchoides TaxID=125765 RepID=UPI003A9A208D